jgi:hypothetical protein
MRMTRALVAAVLLAAGCGSTPPAGDATPAPTFQQSASPEATTTAMPTERATDPPPTATPQPAALGTRDAPFPLGTEFTIDDWRVTVVSVELDAWDVIEAENQFNDPPAEGRQFVMFRVAATYEGDETGNPWLDLSWAIVGSAGNTFGTSMDDNCGVIPDPLRDQGETFPGGRVEGNECVSVESSQLIGATIRVQAGFLGDDRVFVALD